MGRNKSLKIETDGCGSIHRAKMPRSAECGRLRQHGDSEIATFDVQVLLVFGMMAGLVGALVEMLRCVRGGARAIRSIARSRIGARVAHECVNRKSEGE